MGSLKMTVWLVAAAFALGGGLWAMQAEAVNAVAVAAERAVEDGMRIGEFLRYLFVAIGGALVLFGLWKLGRGRARGGGPGVAPAVALGLLMVVAVEPALAKDLGDMARKSATALESFPLVVQILFYVVGGFLVLMGFYKFKRMQDNPQQQSFMGAVVTGLVGVAMIFFPSAVEMLGGTLDLGAGGTLTRPRMQ